MIMNEVTFIDFLRETWKISCFLFKEMPFTTIALVLWAIFLIIWFFARLKYQKDNHFI